MRGSWSVPWIVVHPHTTYIVMAYIVIACIIMAYIVLAYVVMAYIVMALVGALNRRPLSMQMSVKLRVGVCVNVCVNVCVDMCVDRCAADMSFRHRCHATPHVSYTHICKHVSIHTYANTSLPKCPCTCLHTRPHSFLYTCP